MMTRTQSPIIIVHGGAGKIPHGEQDQYNKGVIEAVEAGYDLLRSGSSLEAVVEAVRCMEDNPILNAGLGSALTIRKTVEMDALVIDGSTNRMGGVMGVSKVRNPVLLSKIILEKDKHLLYATEGAHEFARNLGMELISPEELITPRARDLLESYLSKLSAPSDSLAGKTGTVGAVAIDHEGNLAAATSTGGIRGKEIGRIGDTPIPGAGTWADDELAFSATGVGEWIIKTMLGLRTKMHLLISPTAEHALKRALNDMRILINGTAGAIVVTRSKGWVAFHTTPTMAWAMKEKNMKKSFLNPSGW